MEGGMRLQCLSASHSALVNLRKESRPMRIRGPLLLLLVIAAIALLSTAGRILGLYTDWL